MNKLKLNAQNMYMHYIEKLQLCHNIMFVMHAILQHVFLCKVYQHIQLTSHSNNTASSPFCRLVLVHRLKVEAKYMLHTSKQAHKVALNCFRVDSRKHDCFHAVKVKCTIATSLCFTCWNILANLSKFSLPQFERKDVSPFQSVEPCTQCQTHL